MQTRLFCLGVAAWLVLAPGAAPAQETFSEIVTMDDGVGLHTAVTLPADGEAPYPVVFIRSPYQDDYVQLLSLVANLGYAVVIQDTRGTGQSGGENTLFFSDHEDGHQAAAWLLEQPWCDGSFSVWGASALAIPGYLMAPGAPPEMVCQMLAIATPDVYAHAAFYGGVFKQSDVTGWLKWVGAKDRLAEIEERRWCDDFWDPVRVVERGAEVRSAALHIGGWYDVFAEGTLAGFAMYRDSDDPPTAAHQYVIMGPWEHFKMGEAGVGELTFPGVGELNYLVEGVAWLDWCHDVAPDAIDAWPPIRYFTMGAVDDPDAPGNVWRGADSWPPPFVERPLFLRPDGATLGWETPADDPTPLALPPLDPEDPSPTVGGRNLDRPAGPRDQATVEGRADAVVLSTAPLTEPLRVTGPVAVHLRVTTDGPDADVAVRLTDVYPDGRSMLVLDGIQRLSARDGCAEIAPVPVGEAVEIEVELGNTSWVFAAGHHIRIVLSASNYPRFELNPAVVAAVADGAAPTTTVAVGGPSSFVRLPIPAVLPAPPDGAPEEAEPGPDAAEPGPTEEAQPEPEPEPRAEPGPEPEPEPEPPDTTPPGAVAGDTDDGCASAARVTPEPLLLALLALLVWPLRRTRWRPTRRRSRPR